jgi:hypothetical protein
LEKKRERKGIETPTWEALLECFEALNGKHLPLFWREPAKNSKLMFVGNVVKNTQNNSEIFVCVKQQFISKI